MFKKQHKKKPLRENWNHRRLNVESLENRLLLSAVTYDSVFSLHSLEGAAHTIYLDFDGHTTTDTPWNTRYGSEIVSPAFDTDGDPLTFSDQELDLIFQIWSYTSEFFAPFEVNVTTEDPGTEALKKSDSQDTEWGIRVVLGSSSTDWYGSVAGGVAYIGSFTHSKDVPCFIFSEANYSSAFSTARSLTHEVGHSLGLRHDSTAEEEYYPGDSEGIWSPIMGHGSGSLQQWSKGEYPGATNLEDDLAIITGENGFTYRADDFGNSAADAQPLETSGTRFEIFGCIEQNTDQDTFSFTLTEDTYFSVTLSPVTYNLSLDTRLELRGTDGKLIAESDPINSVVSEIVCSNLAAGTYTLTAANAGRLDTYSTYGSLGNYQLQGTLGISPDLLVTTALDVSDSSDGLISLREAIENAQENDRIFFDPNVFQKGTVIQLNDELIIDKTVILDASNLYDSKTQTPGITLKAAEEKRILTCTGNFTKIIGLKLTGGNCADVKGAGAILAEGDLEIEKCLITGNSGGAIGNTKKLVSIRVSNSVISENSGTAAIYLAGPQTQLELEQCLVAGNHATSTAGILKISYSNSSLKILNSAIVGNKAYGGTVDSFGQTIIQNSTIAGNVSSRENVGVNFSTHGSHLVENSIICDNFSMDAGALDVTADAGASIRVSHSLIGNADNLTDTSGSGNIFGSAQNLISAGFRSFTQTTYQAWTKDLWKTWDFQLTESSPALNAGSLALTCSALGLSGTISESEALENAAKLRKLKDVTGTNARLDGTSIDMGAYEFVETLPPPPLVLKPVCVTETAVTLNSSGGAENSTYLLEYSQNSNFTNAQSLSLTGREVTVSGLSEGSTWFFRLKSFLPDETVESDCANLTVELLKPGDFSTVITAAPTSSSAAGKPESLTMANEWDTLWVECWSTQVTSQTFEFSCSTDHLSLAPDLFQTQDGVEISISDPQIEDGIASWTVTAACTNSDLFLEGTPVCFAALAFTPVPDVVPLGSYASGVLTVQLGESIQKTGIRSVIYDLDRSGSVDIQDLIQFAKLFSKSTDSNASNYAADTWKADFNSSGEVDVMDLIYFAQNFSKDRSNSSQITYADSYIFLEPVNAKLTDEFFANAEIDLLDFDED